MTVAVLDRVTTPVATPTALQDTPPLAAPPETVDQKLFRLETEAIRKGIDQRLLEEWRAIGDCSLQKQERIGKLEAFNITH